MSLPAFTNVLLLYHLFGLYAFMGLHAPLPTKITCIRQSTSQVQTKFTQPLAFDPVSKNALREFWHYSYFKQCLYQHGLDSRGRPLLASSVTSSIYQNPQASLTLTGSNPAILADNQLNVDYDDRLLLSKLFLSGQPLTLAVYTRHDDLHYATQAAQITYFPGQTDLIISATPSGNTAFLTDAAGRLGMLFFSSQNLPRLLYGSNLTPEFLMNLIKLKN